MNNLHTSTFLDPSDNPRETPLHSPENTALNEKLVQQINSSDEDPVLSKIHHLSLNILHSSPPIESTETHPLSFSLLTESVEDKMKDKLDAWVQGALPGENREEAKKRIEECLHTGNRLLNLQGLGLTSLPEIWDYPVFATQLEKIDLSNNNFSHIPQSFSSLQGLKALIFLNCKLSILSFVLNNLLPKTVILSENTLLRAIQADSPETIKRLATAGLDINQKIEGRTLLMIAARAGSKKVVNFLLEEGADVYAKSVTGLTAIRYAAINGQKEIVSLLEPVMIERQGSASVSLEHGLEHGNLIALMKPLYGDQVNETGICHGFALMGIQAILSGHLEQFNSRINRLASLLKEEAEKSPLTDETYASLIQKLEEQKDVDLLSFLEGIQVCVKGGDLYPHLFTETNVSLPQQHRDFIKKALSIIGSEAFHEKGEPLDIPVFSGVYDKQDLIHYFTSLESLSTQEPIALKLGSRHHAITVGYDPTQKTWSLIGANNMFARNFPSMEELVDNIEMEFGGVAEFSDGSSVMSTLICVMGKKEETQAWREKIQAWKENKDLKTSHSLENLSTEQKNSLMQEAAEAGDMETITACLANKITVNTSNAKGFTALYMAAHNGHLDVVKALIAAGADLNTSKETGTSPLSIAAEKGHLEIVEALIGAGAQVNSSNENEISPLYIAAEKGHLPVMQALIAGGADLNGSKTNEATPLFVAARLGHLDIVKALIGAGANLDKSTLNEASPLLIATQKGHLDIVTSLIKAGANLDKPMTDGDTPLLIAIQYGYPEIAQMLMEKGADLNKPNAEGLTPFVAAAKSGQKTIIQALLKERNKRAQTNPQPN